MRKLKRCIAFILAMLIIMTTNGWDAFVYANAETIQANAVNANVAATTAETIQLTGICDYESAYAAFDLMNKERIKVGLSALQMDETLLDAAMLRAAEIVVRYTDTRPDGSNYNTVCEGIASEIIAAGQEDAKTVIANWMGTEEQKDTILKEAYQSAGIGCYERSGVRYWVLCFSSKAAVVPKQPENCEMVYQISADLSNMTCVVEKDNINMNVGESKMVRIILNSDEMYQPLEADYDSYTWANSNPQIVKVVKGEVIALASGSAKIIANIGSHKVTIHVYVAEEGTTQNSSSATSEENPLTSEAPAGSNKHANTTTEAADHASVTTEEPEIDMDKVTLQKKEVTGYMLSQYKSNSSHTSADVSIKINSAATLDQKEDKLKVTCQSSNKKVTATAKVKNNVLKINAYSVKKADTILKVKIDGKTFKIKLHLRFAHISQNSYLLVKGKTKKLSIVGCDSDEIKWSSSDESIATVSEDGTVTGIRIGNVVITGQIGNQRVGCAVSVTTSQLKKVCARARYMGRNWRYSQARRCSNGYYDCSSLVWKAYKMYGGTTFGSDGYPSVAQSEAVWCKNHKCMVKGGFSASNVKNMKVNPGDLLFKSYYSTKSYSGIYHVEMFTGYTCLGYMSDGTPILGTMWGARKVNYAKPQGQLLGRPDKA